MTNHSDFQQLMHEYMQKNFDHLIEMNDDEQNNLFNMMIAHLLINWDNNSQQQTKHIDPLLDEIIHQLDDMLIENEKSFEQTIQLLKSDPVED